MDAGWVVFIAFIVCAAAFGVYEYVEYKQQKRRLIVVLEKYGDRTSMELRRDHGFGYDVYPLLVKLKEDGEIVTVWKESQRYYRRSK